ncbi:hypothetical protein GC169_08125 [bacterium]|nr:hypothetical protein [bacterium]
MIMIRTTAAIAAATMLLGACVYVRADGDLRRSVHYSGSGLYGAVVTSNDEIRIISPSNGCTTKADYRSDVDRADGVYLVRFKRVKDDPCRALIREGVELTYTFEELEVPRGARVVLAHHPSR